MVDIIIYIFLKVDVCVFFFYCAVLSKKVGKDECGEVMLDCDDLSIGVFVLEGRQCKGFKLINNLL